MLILGIDPSLTSTGWALLDFETDKVKDIVPINEITLLNQNNEYKPELIDYGTFETSSKDRLCHRVLQQKIELENLLLKHDPKVFVSEDQYGYLNTKTLKRLSHVRGQYMAVAAEKHKPFVLYTPSQVKKNATGKGNAKKKDVIKSINEYFDLELSNDNIADAIGVGLSYILNPKDGTNI